MATLVSCAVAVCVALAALVSCAVAVSIALAALVSGAVAVCVALAALAPGTVAAALVPDIVTAALASGAVTARPLIPSAIPASTLIPSAVTVRRVAAWRLGTAFPVRLALVSGCPRILRCRIPRPCRILGLGRLWFHHCLGRRLRFCRLGRRCLRPYGLNLACRLGFSWRLGLVCPGLRFRLCRNLAGCRLGPCCGISLPLRAYYPRHTGRTLGFPCRPACVPGLAFGARRPLLGILRPIYGCYLFLWRRRPLRLGRP